MSLYSFPINININLPLFGVPVGTILPYVGPINSLPPHWQLCDGRTVVDPHSPFNNKKLPNLIDNRFLMGVSPDLDVPVEGGDNNLHPDGNHTHEASLSLGEAGIHSHNHNLYTGPAANANTDGYSIDNDRDNHPHATGTNHNHGIGGTIMDDGHHKHKGSVTVSGVDSHNHGGDNRPAYCSVYYIIRIK